MYENAAEAEHRLYGTVIMYDGKPVYCAGVQGVGANGALLKLNYLPLQKGGRALGDDATIDMSAPGLQVRELRFGYMNSPKNAYYIVRNPNRHFKQGVTQNSLYSEPVEGDEGRAAYMTFGAMLQEPGFVDMMRGVYPTPEQAIDKLLSTRDIKAVAFTRDLCIRRDFGDLISLMFKNDKVAWSEDGRRFKLAEDFKYLKECLAERNVNLR